MRALSALELLDVWERGLTQSPIQRSLTLLAVACPERPPEKLATLSIGQRDGLLLTLREWTFGTQLVSVATCPKCSDRLELSFTVSDIRVTPAIDPASVLLVEVEDYQVQFRLPHSLDLEHMANQPDLSGVRQQLLERCILSAHQGDRTLSFEELPAPVLNAVVEQMAQADPQADVQLALSCPACNHQWQTTFDVVSFFWSEIHAWGMRVLREVHTLASTYGWREADILAISSQRRQIYLEMICRGRITGDRPYPIPASSPAYPVYSLRSNAV